MSSEKGNVARKRAQKHQNIIRFKNDKYDKSEKMKRLNAMVHTGVCKRCKEVLEWKIKYNKYKPLNQARKCVRCLQKTVKDSYHVMCKPCAFKLELCAKCGKKEEIVNPLSSAEDQRENGDAEINPGRRSRIRSGKGDDDDNDGNNSIDDSDFDSDEGNDEKDQDHSLRSPLTCLPTPHMNTILQKEKATNTEEIKAHGGPDISTLTLDV
ncbi:uncharacterized protein C9orf85 homolog isoform X2 [Carcharodon carcharias]|nr:uncharacterized protein C9orf85 homolog isoform X2 [Carcharodon carcharias]